MVAVRRFYCIAVPSGLLFLTFFLFVLRSGLSPRIYHNNPKEGSDTYDWTTHSQFSFPTELNSATASFDELCAHFPTHLLQDIQPVLKTGHGVIDTRLAAQLKSVSACLGTSLLILSDKGEVYQNHSLIDVIGEIPKSWRDEHADQFQAYDALSDSSIEVPEGGAWKIDKFKFLVSASTAWRMRPNRRWYVFYEGDTYVFWDNVFRFLDNFDPDQPWYFGSPSPGRFSHRKWTKTWFGNGGPGFIVSREALRRITRGDWDSKTGEYLGPMLTREHWKIVLEDCCGDSVFGWSLFQQDVPLSGIWPMMNPHSPEGVPFEDRYWCQPVMTMHKPQIDKMEQLWRWQWTARQPDRPLLYRDLALSYHRIDTWTVKNSWRNDEWGAMDLPSLDPAHTSPMACEAACREHNECFQWTFRHPDHCTMVNNFRAGHPMSGDRDENGVDHWYSSGWMTDKIRDWAAARPCDQPIWVRPSSTRIF